MASEEDNPPAYDDFEDDDEDTDPEPLNGGVPDEDDVVPADSDSSSDATAVTVAIPSSIAAPSATGVTIALPDPKRLAAPSAEKKPIDDSRRLFQRLWTDEDEIELLQGFLEYTTTRGTTSSGHHLDTAAFYDQIKSKLQLDFNKNQLVEKLRRLKKKYRTVLSKMSSGKEFVFKSPHDQATFEISRKIWSNVSVNHRGPVEFDDDDQHFNQNPNPSPNPVIMAATPPPMPNSSSYIISHINLNNAATPMEQKPTNFELMMGSNLGGSPASAAAVAAAAAAAAAKLSSRKRPRIGIGKLDDKFVRVDLGPSQGGNANVNANSSNVSNNNAVGNNVHVGSTMQGLIEETVRNCLSPMFKDLINNAVNGAGLAAGGGSSSGVGIGSGIRGVGALAMNAIPLNFPGVNVGSSGEVMDERWRRQQILELEVYSKRLELVQDQIKLTLEELRSMGG